MKRRYLSLVGYLTFTLILFGCTGRNVACSIKAPSWSVASSDPATDKWLGQWNGPEGTIRATSGAETGMKWLSDKLDCLTIRPGEGYCRD